MLVALVPFLMAVVSIVSYCLSGVFLVVLVYPNFYVDPWWVRLQLARGNAVCERTNGSESGRASASMNAASRERFIPAAAADAVTPTYLRATVAASTPRTPSERPWPYDPCYESLLL